MKRNQPNLLTAAIALLIMAVFMFGGIYAIGKSIVAAKTVVEKCW
jgi:hypothetical protein